MSPKLISVLKFGLLLIIGVALLAFAFRGMNVRRIIDEMLEANLFWLLLSIFISVVALISRAYRWKLLIEPLGHKPPLKSTFYSLMVGYFANLAFPRLGEVTRCGALARAESIPFNMLLGTVVVERAVDVISLLICILLTAIIEFERLGNLLVRDIGNPILGKFARLAGSPIIIIVTALILVGALFLYRSFHNKQRTPKKSKVLEFVKGLGDGLKSIARLQRPWSFAFHSIFIWILYFLSAYVAFFALPSTSGLGLRAGLFVLVAGGLGMSAPVQGGVGAYHVLVSQGLILYGLSRQQGLAFATLVHTSTILVIIFFGLASLLLLFVQKRKKPRSIETSKMNA